MGFGVRGLKGLKRFGRGINESKIVDFVSLRARRRLAKSAAGIAGGFGALFGLKRGFQGIFHKSHSPVNSKKKSSARKNVRSR